MYTQHFGLAEPPFSIAPNPRYLYLSPQHREALAHLLYGIGVGGGFVALTGEVGTGKTTLCRCLLEQLPEDVEIALIFNPRLDSRELLASLCDEFHIAHPGAGASLKQLIDLLNRHLLEVHAAGRRAIVLIDEAQNLSFEVLEQVRLLTNLETNRAKLLQIILVGQPELAELLAQPELRQLSQRITARYHLRPLSKAETQEYIGHRLAVCGVRQALFSRAAIAEIHRRAEGVPRLVNVLCDRALLGAYSLGQSEVNRRIACKSARELLLEAPRRRWPRLAIAGPLLLALAAGAAYVAGVVPGAPARPAWAEALGHWPWFRSEPAPVPPTAQAAAPAVPVPVPAAAAPQVAAVAAPAEPVAQAPAPPAPPTATAPPSIPAAGPEPAPANPDSGSGPNPAAPVAVPAASTPQPPMPLAERLADPGLNQRAAFVRLLSLWKLEPPPADAEPCAYAAGHGLKCLSLHGAWFRLRGLGRPAVLELVLPGGGRRYVVLTAAGEGRAGLDWGQGVESVPLAEVLALWKGGAWLVWKPPAGVEASLAPGQRGAGVAWLRERLGAPSPAEGADVFDADLAARVLAFQSERGLVPDGKAGPQTLISLEARSGDAAAPKLEDLKP
jgi:general secretion pathway protein A